MAAGAADPAGAAWSEDRARIVELTARYNHAFDRGDVDAYTACFTPDGVMEVDGGPRYEGAAALGEMCRRTPTGTIMHVTTDAVVEVDGDRATQDVTLVVVGLPAEPGGRTRVQAAGHYRDELVRTAEGWRFAHRRARLHGGLGGDR